MSVFNQAINGFRSTMSRAGKFYNSTNGLRGRAVASYMARAARINPRSMAPIGVAAAVGAGGGAVFNSDHRAKGAIGGGVLAGGGMLGYGAYNVWNKMTPAIRGLLR